MIKEQLPFWRIENEVFITIRKNIPEKLRKRFTEEFFITPGNLYSSGEIIDIKIATALRELSEASDRP
jgi:hypothetical protein